MGTKLTKQEIEKEIKKEIEKKKEVFKDNKIVKK